MNNRYEELDSLRGIASLSVFFGHILLIFNATFLSKLIFEYGPLRGMVAGTEAVILFFLLSGFVLSLPFYPNKQSNYVSYVIKRICRIYIPYVVTITIALIGMKFLYSGNIEELSNWFNGKWSSPITTEMVLAHSNLLGTFSSSFNPVVWSLVHEIRISLIFPFIMYFVIRRSFTWSICLALFLSAISLGYVTFGKATYLGTEIYATIHYTSIFIMGALLAKYRNEIKKIFITINMKSKLALFVIGFILFIYAHPSFILNMMIDNFNPFYRTVIDSWFIAVGAAILLVFAMYSARLSKILRYKFINFIGKVSYSLYLIHIPTLFSCVHLLNNVIPIWGIIIIAILVSLLVSGLLYFLVEKPAINLGRILIKPLNNKVEVSAKSNQNIS